MGLPLIWMVFLIILFFFRDPGIELPPQEAVISPVTGTIISIDTTESDEIHFVIFLSLFDQHAIRVPVTGEIVKLQSFAGKFHPAYQANAGSENEHTAILLRTHHGDVLQKIYAGFVARRILVHASAGDSVAAGQRIGFIRFGSRAELWFPPEFVPDVHHGDHLRGGRTPLGSYRPERVVQ